VAVGNGSDLRLMTAAGLALASARSAFMVTMVVVVVIAMAINATDTLIIVDVGTLGIDSAGLGTVVAIISGGGWRPDQLLSTGDAVQPPPSRSQYNNRCTFLV
jgi:hypothetical protein